MKTSEILARVNEALNEIDHDVTPRGILANLAADLEGALRMESAASAGRLSATKTIAAMLKQSLKSNRTGLAYPWTDAEGRQCVCDGYRAFRLKDPLPLDERPENVGPGIDLDKIYPASLDGWQTVALPSAGEVKAFIATERAKWTGKAKNFFANWSFGEHAPTVNAQYLLDALAVFPDATEARWLTLVNPLYICGEAGDGLLLPLRVDGKTESEKTPEQAAAIERENKASEQRNREAAERSQAILKARDEMIELRDKVKALRIKQLRAVEDFPKLETDELRTGCQRVYDEACRDEAKALLRGYELAKIEKPEHSLEPEQFAAIVAKLYAGQPA